MSSEDDTEEDLIILTEETKVAAREVIIQLQRLFRPTDWPPESRVNALLAGALACGSVYLTCCAELEASPNSMLNVANALFGYVPNSSVTKH